MCSTRRRRDIEEYIETFKEGRAVEVSSEEEGLRGSWYTATVIRQVSPTSLKILVEYHNFISDHDPSSNLQELVDAILIRPIPPLDPDRVFHVMEQVDAFHNDGWWEGVVMEIDLVNRMYSVFFRCSREQLQFCANDLRLHREWVRGNLWDPPLVAASSFTELKRKKGEDGEDGGRSTGGSGQKKRREGERRSIHSPIKQGGAGGHGLVMNNGGNRERMHNSKQVVCALGMQKQRGCNNGVTRYGTLKEPRTRATNHTGGRALRR